MVGGGKKPGRAGFYFFSFNFFQLPAEFPHLILRFFPLRGLRMYVSSSPLAKVLLGRDKTFHTHTVFTCVASASAGLFLLFYFTGGGF